VSLNSTVLLAQSSDDSTRMYCTPIWKIRKVVYKAQVADSVIQHGEKENLQLSNALRASDSVSRNKDRAILYATERGVFLETALSKTEELVKQEHRKTVKWKVGAIFSAIVIVAMVVFGG